MSVHIAAKKGDIAETVLLPGDPKRAAKIAATFFEDAVCYNDVRGMSGFTGYFQGKRVSVQATGMGIPSAAIYLNELIHEYDAQTLIRIGTTGAVAEHIKVGTLIIPIAAATDSQFFQPLTQSYNIALAPDSTLLLDAIKMADEKAMQYYLGSILTTDNFYDNSPQRQQLYDYGVLSVDMETAGLFYLAQQNNRQALSILTVSDHIITGESTPPEVREQEFLDMVRLSLEVAVKK